MALRLSKSGYGNIKELLDYDSELFLSVFEYDIFCTEFEEKFFELNRPKT